MIPMSRISSTGEDSGGAGMSYYVMSMNGV